MCIAPIDTLPKNVASPDERLRRFSFVGVHASVAATTARKRLRTLAVAVTTRVDDWEALALSPLRDNTERLGMNAVEAIFLGFKWTFRSQPVSDYGIDAQVEIWEGG